jgi:hypothetical protein
MALSSSLKDSAMKALDRLLVVCDPKAEVDA